MRSNGVEYNRLNNIVVTCGEDMYFLLVGNQPFMIMARDIDQETLELCLKEIRGVTDEEEGSTESTI